MDKRFYVLLYALALVLSASSSSLDKKFFETELKNLRKFAGELVKKFNPEFNPCENFSSYVGEIDIDEILLPSNNRIEDLFNFFISNSTDSAGDLGTKAKQYFASCHDKLEDSFVKVIQSAEIIQDVTEWPVYSKNHNEDWVMTKIALELYGFPFIFVTDVNEKQQVNLFLKLDPPEQTININFINFERGENLADMFRIFGWSNDSIGKLQEQFDKLQVKFDNVAENYQEEKMTLLELQQTIPQVNWTNYLQAVIGVAAESTNVVECENVNMLKDYIEIIENEDKTVFKHFLFAKFLDFIEKDYNKVFKNREFCYEKLYYVFESAFLHSLIRYQLTQNDVENFLNVIENIFSLEEDKFDNPTLKKANSTYKDLQGLSNLLLHREDFDTKIHTEYEDMPELDSSYVSNNLKILRFKTDNKKKEAFKNFIVNNVVAAIDHARNTPMAYYEFFLGVIAFKAFTSAILMPEYLQNNNDNDKYGQYRQVLEFLLELPDYQKKNLQRTGDMFNKEDEVLAEFNLTRKKVSFTLFTQALQNQISNIQVFLNDIENFRKEYNCSLLAA